MAFEISPEEQEARRKELQAADAEVQDRRRQEVEERINDVLERYDMSLDDAAKKIPFVATEIGVSNEEAERFVQGMQAAAKTQTEEVDALFDEDDGDKKAA